MDMKLSISTLGCPAWSFEQILENFSALGVKGIEIRGINGNMDPDAIPCFFPENLDSTKAALDSYGMKIVGFGTSANFHDPSSREAKIDEAKRAIDLCARVGIPSIRVFGNNIYKGDARASVERIRDGIAELCDYAEGKNVCVNLEVHGDINTIERLSPIVESLGERRNFGIIWDIMHSYRVYGNDFEEFYQFLKPYIKHIHLKDCIRTGDNSFALKNLGDGDIDIVSIVNRLISDGYDGYFSFEWEKVWHPELDEPEIAFPRFAEYMKSNF